MTRLIKYLGVILDQKLATGAPLCAKLRLTYLTIRLNLNKKLKHRRRTMKKAVYGRALDEALLKPRKGTHNFPG